MNIGGSYLRGPAMLKAATSMGQQNLLDEGYYVESDPCEDVEARFRALASRGRPHSGRRARQSGYANRNRFFDASDPDEVEDAHCNLPVPHNLCRSMRMYLSPRSSRHEDLEEGSREVRTD